MSLLLDSPPGPRVKHVLGRGPNRNSDPNILGHLKLLTQLELSTLS